MIWLEFGVSILRTSESTVVHIVPEICLSFWIFFKYERRRKLTKETDPGSVPTSATNFCDLGEVNPQILCIHKELLI